MKPKTAIQKKVCGLSAKLPEITDEQQAWAFDKCFERWFVRSRGYNYCLECGHHWKQSSYAIPTVAVCPQCEATLNITKNYRRGAKQYEYWGIITTQGDMQVVRIFFASKFMKKYQQATYNTFEVMQHWVGADGKSAVMSKAVQGLSGYIDSWVPSSDLEVRPGKGSYNSSIRYRLSPFAIWPKRKVLPELRRNGFKGRFYGLAPQTLFRSLMTNTQAETLLKAGQIELLTYAITHGIAVCDWPTIRICIRNRYRVKDPTLYFDYIDLLRRFNKYCHNPAYVCPPNLKQVHNRLVEKRRQAIRKQEQAERWSRIAMEEVEYAAAKSVFFDLQFTTGDIQIVPISTVEGFVIEGEVLDHCVFTNEYYKKPNSLILSARVNNTPVETVEVSLKSLEVIQARGKNNQPSRYHDEILQATRDNMYKIKQRICEA